MKIHQAFALTVAAAGFLAFAVPAPAQSHGNRGGGGNSNHGGNNNGGYHHGGGNHYYGHHGYYHGGNFYFAGAFGYPFFGYPYYGYPYGYAPYGYGYGYPAGAYVTYDPRGVYQGRVVSGGAGRSSLAAQVQQELAAAGYYHGAIDGIVGDGTRRAIRNYERANGLPGDGRIDDQLLAAVGVN